MYKTIILIFILSFPVSANSNRNVTFDFQSISLPDALQLLADYKGQNIIVAPDVRGDITLKLKDVSWSTAFDYVMSVGRLDAEFVNDEIFIKNIGSDYSISKPIINNQSSSDGSLIYPMQLFKLNNILPSVIADLFHLYPDEVLTPSNDTSSLIAHLSSSRFVELSNLIDSLDVVKPQLLIEAKIVEVNRDYSDSLGVNWDLSSSGSISFNGSSLFGAPAAAGVGLGFIGSKFALDASLNLMESKGKGAVMSSPKVFVFDRKTAVISKGFEVPYQETQGDGVITTSFKSADLSLSVTPVVNGSNVMLDINLNKNEPDFSKVVSGQPPITTTSFSSSVRLFSGDTVALGGVFSRSSSNSSSGVPVLSSIPFLGALFRGSQSKDLDSELLLFITATLVDHTQSLQGFDFSQYMMPVHIKNLDIQPYYMF